MDVMVLESSSNPEGVRLDRGIGILRHLAGMVLLLLLGEELHPTVVVAARPMIKASSHPERRIHGNLPHLLRETVAMAAGVVAVQALVLMTMMSQAPTTDQPMVRPLSLGRRRK